MKKPSYKLTAEHKEQLEDLLQETIITTLNEDFDFNFSKQDSDSDDFDDEKFEEEVDKGCELAVAYLIKRMREDFGTK